MSSSSLPVRAGADRPAALMVTQEELSLYLKLCEAEKERQVLRRKIIEDLDQGAAAEPGALTVEVRRSEARMFSAGKLRVLLGSAKTEELRSQVEPTISRRLIVRAQDTGVGNAGWAQWL
jgi:hypothetical protein